MRITGVTQEEEADTKIIAEELKKSGRKENGLRKGKVPNKA